MTVGEILRVLFYLWLLVSVSVWTYRIYRKIFKRDSPAANADSPATTAPRTDSPNGSKTSRTGPGASSPSTRSSSLADEPGDLVKAVIREELEEQRRAKAAEERPPDTVEGNGDLTAGSSQRHGLFAATDRPGPDKPSRATIAEALAGIDLPCNLVPTVMHGEEVDEHRSAFVTAGFPAAMVASEVADELERLAFTIRTEADDVAVARRDGIELRIEVIEDAASNTVDGERRFRYVPAGSVAIVFTT